MTPIVKDLTPREEEIMSFIVQGWSIPEIAKQFGISTRTVQTHTRTILRRYNQPSRLRLIASYWKSQIVTEDAA